MMFLTKNTVIAHGCFKKNSFLCVIFAVKNIFNQSKFIAFNSAQKAKSSSVYTKGWFTVYSGILGRFNRCAVTSDGNGNIAFVIHFIRWQKCTIKAIEGFYIFFIKRNLAIGAGKDIK